MGWALWMWRQLTSMRVALLLLMLLAVAALPGSFFPQRPQAPERVAQYVLSHPGASLWLERFGFFDVYASPWFSAVYLLLFISLVGCILPRAAVHLRAVRADPPRAPRSFARFPVRDEFVVDTSAEDVQAAALAALRRRYRARAGVEEGAEQRAGADAEWGVGVGGGAVVPAASRQRCTVSAERGYLRESGNLVFHLALVGLLVAVALGQLLSYRGQAIVVEGRGFANAVVDYDSFHSGTWFRDEDLEPFALTLDRFESTFDDATAQARDFTAFVTLTGQDGMSQGATIKVNEPLSAGGALGYLSGNGYAPTITVRDGSGAIAFSGSVPFLPQDDVYTSRGVVKVPDVAPGRAQLGFVGYLLPTAVVDTAGARSVFPAAISPLLVLTAYAGDLGLDSGIPQNVYELDTSAMTQVTEAAGGDTAGTPLTLFLEPGHSVDLPDGLGSITFDALPTFVALDFRHDPALGAVLAFALLALAGLGASLFLPRRRLWLRATPLGDGRTVVAAAALARGDDPGLRADLDHVLDAVRRASGTAVSSAAAGPRTPDVTSTTGEAP